MGKYRMEEPWGYLEERDYKSNSQEEVSIAGLFDKVEYNKGDNKMYFYDKYGSKCGTIDVSEFEEETIVEKAYYDKETEEIVIEFVNGDVVRINIKEVLDENEFKDGLQVNDGVVSILIDSAGEGYEGNPYLSTSESGLKISGIDKHIDDDVEAERVRAVAEEERIDAKLDAEITRATAEEARIDAKLDAEIERAKAEELAANRRIDRLNDELDAEKTIREAADAALGRRIDQEIDDRIADVNAEEERAIAAEEALQAAIDDEAARATSAETALDEKIDTETERATAAEEELDAKIVAETERAEAAESAITDAITAELERIDGEISVLQDAIDTEVNRAVSAETELDAKIVAETERAQAAEEALDAKIDESVSSITDAIASETEDRKAQAIHSAEYVKADNKIYFKNANNEAISTVDTTDFVVDGMVEDVKIENGNLVITFNTDSGKQDISIPLTEIFNPSNYYTKDDVDGKVATINESIADEASTRESGDTALDEKITALEGIVDTKANAADVETEIARATAEEAKKVDKEIHGTNGKAIIFNESDGGGAKFEHNDGTESFVGVNDGGENGLVAQIYADKFVDNKWQGAKLDVTNGGMYYTVGSDNFADRAVAANEIAVKGDIPTNFYSQEEVDALIRAKETEIYNLTKLVGEIGGNVTYTYPNELGTSLTELMKNNGTVKLTEDATISRFGPGVTAKNKVTINLNNHNLTSTGASSYGAIQSRGTEEITIGGKGTIDAGDGICIEANGTSSLSPLTTINLTGSTTTYRTNRPGGELIYCYVGIINITNGTFRNDGASEYTLNCYDANYAAGTAKIIVSGGKFYDFDPGNNNAEGPGTSFLAEGYHTEASTVIEDGVEHTVYTVKKDA